MKRKILKTLSMMIATVLLLTSLSAVAGAANDGQMSISVGDAKSKFIQSGILFSAYLLARGDYGDWTPVDDFNDIKITSRDDGSAWIDKSMKQIKSKIKRFNLQPVKNATTNASGKALFTDLEYGIYYVEATKCPDYNLKISAMLLSTPNKEKEVKITANAKYEYNPLPPGDDDGGETPSNQVKKLIVPIRRGERLVLIDEYETALGLGNIQIHVGVCYE